MKRLMILIFLLTLSVSFFGQKISELPAASTVHEEDVTVIVQSGVTRKISMETLLDYLITNYPGDSLLANSVTISGDTLIIGTDTLAYSGGGLWTVNSASSIMPNGYDTVSVICPGALNGGDTIIYVDSSRFSDQFTSGSLNRFYDYSFDYNKVNGDYFGCQLSIYMNGDHAGTGLDTLWIDAIGITVYYNSGSSQTNYAGNVLSAKSSFPLPQWQDTINGTGLPDDTYTFAKANYSYPQSIRAMDFGFSIPNGATIDSIVPFWEGHSWVGAATISTAVVFPNGLVTGDELNVFHNHYVNLESDAGTYFPALDTTLADTTYLTCNKIETTGIIKGDIITVNEILNLPVKADPPDSPVEGMVYADTDHHLYYYNGSTWKQLDN